MDTRKPAAYGQCPYRGGRPAQASQMMRAQMPANRASAAALSQPRPAVQPEIQAIVQPAEPAPPPPPVRTGRVWLSAYAKDFTAAAQGGTKEALPLETQRTEGGMALGPQGAQVPEDGYYMVLWELGVDGARGEATLQLGVNEAMSQLTYPLRQGYDNGQQVTWLNKGDKLGLFFQAGEDQAEVRCGSAQFTVIRLG